MTAEAHNIRFFWCPEQSAPQGPRECGIETETPEDVVQYQDEVEAMERFREELRERAYAVTGAVHDLPTIPGGPQLVERPVTSLQAGQRYVAWNIFAVDLEGNEINVNKRIQGIGGGVMWAETVRVQPERKIPPEENIAKGYKCEDCRRFSYAIGQQWLKQETHRFEKASAAMWQDILEIIAENEDVEAPNSLEVFGACLEESKLIPKNHPGCAKYVPKFQHSTGVQCLNKTPEEEHGRARTGL